MVECNYRTDETGKLCIHNEHPKVVEHLYEVKIRVAELKGQHEELDELIELIECELFSENGMGFAKWIRHTKLKREIDNLEELKITSWDNARTARLKKQIKRLLYRVVA